MKSLLVLVVVIAMGCEVILEEDCASIHSFLKHYQAILRHLPDMMYPVSTMCTDKSAVDDYHQALMFYTDATSTSACQKYFKRNRMNVFEQIYGQLTDLWSTANCDACISAPNTTAEFMDLSNRLQRCLDANQTTPCSSCDDDYQRVQHLYGQMEKERHGSANLCFDIEDRMNQTRRAWSGQYNCCKDKNHNTIRFFSIASVACAVPVAFYIAMYIITVQRDSSRITLLSATSGGEAQLPSSSRSTEACGSQSSAGHIVKAAYNPEDSDTDNLSDLNKNEGDLIGSDSSIPVMPQNLMEHRILQ